MHYGVVFPQIEIGADPVACRDFAQTAEGHGFDGLMTYDHVLGADTSVRPGWSGWYQLEDMFHEPFVLFGHLAAVTERIRFVTGILILPQRQSALVAKQAAEVDVLSGGRMTLGIGVGWNDVEFEALGQNFNDRGRRSEEQIEVMRRLWTEDSVDFSGNWHRVPAAGINPLPVQAPDPGVDRRGGGTGAAARRANRRGLAADGETRRQRGAARTSSGLPLCGGARRRALRHRAGRRPARPGLGRPRPRRRRLARASAPPISTSTA